MRTALLLCSFLVVLGSACDRPSEAQCKEAVENVRRIIDQNPGAVAAPSAIEDCRADDSKKKVECHRSAKNNADLDKCIEL